MLLTVIIVNYNVKHYLFQCLYALRRAIQGIDCEIIVVDNNSVDGSIEYIAQRFPHHDFPQLRIIANKDNPGFGKANNQAFAEAKGRYVLYLNPDTFVCEDTIRQCVDFMENHPNAGCLGVKMINSNGSFAMESRRGVPTPWTSFCKITRLSKLFPRHKVFGRYYLQHLPIEESAEIEIVSGAFMVVRRDVVNKIGAFDEDYFMYCEDTDLSYRMLKSGYNNYYLPARILHYKGESTRKYSYSYVNTFYKAILIFFKKHFNNHLFLLKIIIYFAIYLLAALSFIKRQLSLARYNMKKIISPRKIRMLFVGNAANRDLAEAVAAKYNFEIEYHDDFNIGVDRLQQIVADFAPDYITYDTSAYTYHEILNLAEGLPSRSKCDIGTMYPEHKLIITNLFLCEV